MDSATRSGVFWFGTAAKTLSYQAFFCAALKLAMFWKSCVVLLLMLM
ncbi:MAG: hypothetical protein AW07_02107 [Candidatus Accumulibacter sp. SK-11]|nr:MAG: hypothetical protein AW07_02107 [Candidatus Accumulibacter sp. SK-11]